MNQPDTHTMDLKLIATAAFGLEAVVVRELRALGYAGRVTRPGRIVFRGDSLAICRTNLWLRSAERVVLHMGTFPARDFDQLFAAVQAVDWQQWITPDAELPVRGRSRKSQLTSVPACQRTVKKALVEKLRAAHGVDRLPETGPVCSVEIELLDDVGTLTLDTTGVGLHKRGYRTHVGDAPLRETLAAALVQLSFWNHDRPLLDPFCGIGTLPIEAALIGHRLAPGLRRSFAAEAWPTFDAKAWQQAREEARDLAQSEMSERILGTDINHNALRLARLHAQQAGVADSIHFQHRPFDELRSQRRHGCLITNPPYGQRMGDDTEIEALYQAFPDVLRRLPTWSHYVLTARSDFEALVGQTADRRRKLYNGRIACTYYQFHGPDPMAGSRKATAHGSGRAAPRPARLPNKTRPSDSTVERQPCGEGLGEGKSAKTPCVAPPARERLPRKSQRADDSASADAPAGAAVSAGSDDVSSDAADISPDVSTDISSGSDDVSSDVSTDISAAAASPGVEPVAPRVPPPTAPTPTLPPRPAFGGLRPEASRQAEEFANRLRKRAHHLRRWPTRRAITCYRIYDRDVPEVPLAIDRYEDVLHIAEYARPHDRTPAEHADWFDLMIETACRVLEVPKQLAFVKRRARQRGTAQYQQLGRGGVMRIVHEAGLRFRINLTDYLDTGLFLDHRTTRALVRDAAQGKRVLNLFAYTGSFSVYAAAGGAATTTTVDLLPTHVTWARENMALNGYQEGRDHRFVRADARQYLAALPTGVQFDLAIVDPPTFSNSKRMDDHWDVQQDHAELLNQLAAHLSPGGSVFFSTNFRRFQLDEAAITSLSAHEISRQTVPEDFRNRRIHRSWKLVRKEIT